jgi:hypothetical protein
MTTSQNDTSQMQAPRDVASLRRFLGNCRQGLEIWEFSGIEDEQNTIHISTDSVRPRK